MKYYFSLLLSIFIIASACNKPSPNNEDIPEVFNPDKNLNDLSSIKRGYMNIVDQLYHDLCKKDNDLEILEERIKKTTDDYLEKTQELNRFFSDNENYYQTALSMTGQMTDSVMKNGIITKINTHRDSFYTKHSESKLFLDSLQGCYYELSNLHLALKIKVTMPEMLTYQNSFKHDREALSTLKEDINATIHSIKSKIKE